MTSISPYLSLVVKTVAGKVADKVGEAAFDKVMLAIGLKDEPDKPEDFATYFKRINATLATIKGELNDVQSTVDTIRRTQSKFEASLFDSSYQNALRDYGRDSSLIEKKYEDYHDALLALSAESEPDKHAAAKILFELHDLKAAEPISLAMRNVTKALLGDDQYAGIYQQCVEMLDVYLAKEVATKPVTKKFTIPTMDGPSFSVEYPDSFGVFSQFRDSYRDTIENHVAPIFRHSLILLTKGITILELVYEGTIFAEQLDDLRRDIFEACGKVSSFWEDNTAFNVLSPKLESLFRDHTATVPQAMRTCAWWPAGSVYDKHGVRTEWKNGQHHFPPELGSGITVIWDHFFPTPPTTSTPARETDDKARGSWYIGQYQMPQGTSVGIIQADFLFGEKVRYWAFSPEGSGWGEHGIGFWEAGDTPLLNSKKAPSIVVRTLEDYCAPGDAPPSLAALMSALKTIVGPTARFPPPDLEIGDVFGGGIVVRLRSRSGEAGIVVMTPESLALSADHYHLEVANWETAVERCAAKLLLGYSDWQLPTIEVWELIFSNLIRSNLVKFPKTEYWTADSYWLPGRRNATVQTVRCIASDDGEKLDFNFYTPRGYEAVCLAVRMF